MAGRETGSAPGRVFHLPQRLDLAMVDRGIADSRTRAQRLIGRGSVRVDGQVARKPSQKVGDGSDITVTDPLEYVSRGALKLLGAFDVFSPKGLSPVRGCDCLDIGASTGGFTQVLLEKGARRVIALDVGHGQLAPRLASDPRVIGLEGVNIRAVGGASDLPFQPGFIVSDVSFISLTYVIPVIARICRTASGPTEIILLIKPQFEVGRGRLGKDGVVTDPALRLQARRKVIQCARDNGLTVLDCVDSPIEGTHGNDEYLLWLRAGSSGADA